MKTKKRPTRKPPDYRRIAAGLREQLRAANDAIQDTRDRMEEVTDRRRQDSLWYTHEMAKLRDALAALTADATDMIIRVDKRGLVR